MRTTIEIDETLLREALQATGLSSPSEVVEMGLRSLLRLQNQTGIRQFRGKLDWQGNLTDLRNDE